MNTGFNFKIDDNSAALSKVNEILPEDFGWNEGELGKEIEIEGVNNKPDPEDGKLVNNQNVDEMSLEEINSMIDDSTIVPDPNKKDNKQDLSNADNILTVTASAFKEKGLLDLPDDFDGSEDALYNAFESTVEHRADAFIDSVFESHPEKDRALALFTHIKNGGKVSDFVDTFSTDYSKIDIKDPDVQKSVLKTFYKSTTKFDDSKIDAKIKRFEEQLTLDTEAEDALEQLKVMDAENKSSFIKNTNDIAKSEKDAAKDYITTVKKFIIENESIKGFIPIKDNKTKQEFMDYMLKPNVKLTDGRYVTQSYADSLKESDDVEAHMTREWLKFKKYNLDDAKKEIKKEAVETLADKIKKSNAAAATIKRSNIVSDEDQSGKTDEMKGWKTLLTRNK